MDVKIRHKLIKIEDRVSDRFVILITNYRWLRILENLLFAFAKTKVQISCPVTTQLISPFVFATQIVQYLYFLNPKFQASSHLIWWYSLVCVGPAQKP